jgi:hypothetical protein
MLTTRDKVRRLVITLVVIGCIALLTVAVRSTRRADVDPLPTAGVVEQYFPPPESEALRQQQVGIDLGGEYTGNLIIANRPIPNEELTRRPELNQIFFTPTSGGVFDELPEGRVCAVALVWRAATETSADADRIEWCFNVT